jgi:hypothetical protein
LERAAKKWEPVFREKARESKENESLRRFERIAEALV